MMTLPGLTPDLMLALELADEADRITMSAYLDAELRVATKPDRTPVTEADQGVERALRTLLATRRPDDAQLGEEYGALGHSADRCWIIDPIDGTANFLRGVPVWATLIGLVVDGAATLGVVSAPALGRRWWAADGQARTSDVNGRVRRLRTSAVSEWSDASLAYSDPIGWAPGALGRLADGAWRTRGYGDFLSHMLVAEGAVDVAVEPDLAHLVLEEITQWLDQLEPELGGEPAHVVVQLDVRGLPAVTVPRLDHVGIERALRQEFGPAAAVAQDQNIVSEVGLGPAPFKDPAPSGVVPVVDAPQTAERRRENDRGPGRFGHE